MTERIQEFLRSRRNEGQDVEPCLVVDLEVVRDNYQTFSRALPDSRQGTKNRGSFKSQDLKGQHLSQEMPLKVSSILATVTGSRRRTGAPRSQRGTRLKATTDRAFLVSAGFPSAGANTEEACPSLPGVRAGSFPTNPRQH